MSPVDVRVLQGRTVTVLGAAGPETYGAGDVIRSVLSDAAAVMRARGDVEMLPLAPHNALLVGVSEAL